MTQIKRQPEKHRRAAGFTLIEVLVALVVMTVGMLGVAVLYVEGLRLNRTSIYRTTAVAMAADMAERIRANREAGASYVGVGPGQDGGCATDPGCTPAQLADDDWWRWNNQLRAYLPTGVQPVITSAPAGPGNRLTRFDIRLTWPEVGAPEPVSYTLSVQL